jgi:ketosteroid isomerase-like protein
MRSLALLIAGCAASPPPSAPAVAAAPDVATVRAAAATFDDAQLHGDAATIDRFLAADFVFVRGSGKVADRAAFLAAFTDPKQKLDPFTITNRVFVPLGDRSAIVGGEAVMTGTDDGKPFREHFRYADVFTWRDGRWQVVYTQVTMLPS